MSHCGVAQTLRANRPPGGTDSRSSTGQSWNPPPGGAVRCNASASTHRATGGGEGEELRGGILSIAAVSAAGSSCGDHGNNLLVNQDYSRQSLIFKTALLVHPDRWVVVDSEEASTGHRQQSRQCGGACWPVRWWKVTVKDGRLTVGQRRGPSKNASHRQKRRRCLGEWRRVTQQNQGQWGASEQTPV